MHGERYRVSAGVLTLSMHALFFGALYFGVNWQGQPPEAMEVDLWSQLPSEETAPPPLPLPPPAEVHKAEPQPPKEVEQPKPAVKPDIALPAKKKKPETKQAKEPPKPQKKKMTAAESKKAMADIQALDASASESERKAQVANEEKARQAAKAREAARTEREKYIGLIQSKIRAGIVMPPDVPDNALAKYEVTLLPDGSLLGDPVLVRSSGNAAYDQAVERAIRKARILPLPQDEGAREQFINPNRLKLEFSPGKKE